MKGLLATTGAVILTGSLLSGCATESGKQEPTRTAGKPHYIYLPETTGSHLRRRVLVDENGKAVSETGRDVLNADKSVIEDFQRRSNVRTSGKGN